MKKYLEKNYALGTFPSAQCVVRASSTPVLTLKAAKQIAEEEGICHVYLGNVSL